MNQAVQPAWCCAGDGVVRLTVQVAPNARKTAICGVHDHALKIRLQAQAVEGQANTALCRVLAQYLALPRNAVQLTHGLGSRRKVVSLSCALSAAQVAATLLALGTER